MRTFGADAFSICYVMESTGGILNVMCNYECNMSKYATIATLCLLLMPLIACAEEQNWQFVQSVGGLSVGIPYLDEYSNSWFLPIQCNVSGTQKITVEPKALYSGIICKDVEAEIDGNSVYITLVTKPAGLFSGNASCPPAFLGHSSHADGSSSISAGKYVVYYRGVHEDEGSIFRIFSRTRYETPVKLGAVSIEPRQQ